MKYLIFKSNYGEVKTIIENKIIQFYQHTFQKKKRGFLNKYLQKMFAFRLSNKINVN